MSSAGLNHRYMVRNLLIPDPSWDPTQLPSLLAWYKGDAGVTDAGAGAVSQWNDQSGVGHHLTASGANRPTTGTRTQNGLNVIDFDGANNFMNSNAISEASPFTIIACIKNDDGADGSQQLFFRNSGATVSASVGKETTNAWRASDGTLISGGTPDTNAHVFVVVFNGASSQIWIDGSSVVGPSNAGTNTLDTAIRIGANNAGGAAWDGWIGEVILDGTALGTTNRQSAEAYLKARFATP